VVQALSFPVGVVLVTVLVSAVTDVWKFKVHNAVTLPILAAGLFYHSMVGGPAGLAASFLGALFGFGALILFYVMGGLGGGDVKLLAAIGAWLGVPLTFYVLIASSLAAGAFAALILVKYRMWGTIRMDLRNVWHPLRAVARPRGANDRIEAEVRRADRRRIIPFATMLALGLLGVLGWSWLQGAP
jgi:prepilin peptidase CpaA